MRRPSERETPLRHRFNLDRATDRARRLDMEADAELQLGHHARAEYLALRAAELRGAA